MLSGGDAQRHSTLLSRTAINVQRSKLSFRACTEAVKYAAGVTCAKPRQCSRMSTESENLMTHLDLSRTSPSLREENTYGAAAPAGTNNSTHTIEYIESRARDFS